MPTRPTAAGCREEQGTALGYFGASYCMDRTLIASEGRLATWKTNDGSNVWTSFVVNGKPM